MRTALLMALLFGMVQGLWAGGFSYRELCSLLGDLRGWQAEECTGMDLESPQGRMVMASREYRCKERVLQVTAVTGSSAMAYWSNWASFKPGTTLNTPEQLLKMIQVEGFPVGIVQSKRGKEGVIVVLLGKGEKAPGVLQASFRGLDWEEAIEALKGLPWKDMERRMRQ